jgi:hypothetical protein
LIPENHLGVPLSRCAIAPLSRSRPSDTSNPEKSPCFPLTSKPKDEYNQEEEKTAVSLGRKVL